MMIIILVQSLFSKSSLKESTHSSSLSRMSQSSVNVEQVLGENQIQSTPSDEVSQGTFVKSGVNEGETAGKENKTAVHELQSQEGPKALPSDEDIVSSMDDSSLGLADHQLPFEKRVVFLRRGSAYNVPYLLHCVPVTVDITLVFVCQVILSNLI